MASQFFKKIKVQTDQVRDTLIIGGSTTAYYLAKQLLTMGLDVKIIDKNRERCEELSDLLPKATIICGAGTDQDVLMEEGVNWMDSFVTLTECGRRKYPALTLCKRACTEEQEYHKSKQYHVR